MDSKTKRYFLRTAMLLLLMALTSISAWAETVNGVKYIKYDSENKVYAEATQNDVTVLTGSETTLTAGWYVVNGNVNYNSYLYTEANEGEDVNIILSDGATLTVVALTSNFEGRERLSIYGQSQGTGTANISRSLMGCYSLTIYGGIINANILDCAQGGVGIYGGTVNAGIIKPYGGVYLTGGNVTVTGEIEARDQGFNIDLCGATVKASSYNAARVCIQKGLTYYDGTGASYSGTIEYYQNLLDLKPDEITAIAGKTLRTYDYRDGTCGDPTVNEGKNVTWLYNIATRTLTISGAGAMADFSSKDNQPWKDNRDNITTVVIKNGVTSIGGNAFYGCSSLTSVTVCATACTLGNGAFDGCAILFQLTKKNAGTESESIAYYTTLGDAVNDAADGVKITLLKDYTITVSRDNVTTDTRGVSINKSITLDLNDHKIMRDNKTNDVDDYGGALISIYSRIDARVTLTLVDNGADKDTMGSIENNDDYGGWAIVVGNGSTLIAKGVEILTPDRDTVDIMDDGEAVIDDCVIHGKVGINLYGTATITNSDISGGNSSAIQVGRYDSAGDENHKGRLTIGEGVYISGFHVVGIGYDAGTVILKAFPTFGQNRPTTSSTTRAKARAKTREGEIPYDIGMMPGLSLTFEEGTFEKPDQPMSIYIRDNDRPVDPATYTNPITTNYSKYVKDGDKVINPNNVFKWKENDFTRGFRQNTDEVIFDHAAATVTSYSGTPTPTTKPYYAYYDFSEAIAAANSGYKTASEAGGTEFIPTLKMLDDVSYDASVVIGDGSTVKKVTLDLNDHELKSNYYAGTIIVKNQATLSLVDTGTDPNKKGTIVCSNSNGYAIHNEGTADINGCDLSARCGIYSNNTATIANCAISATTYGIYEEDGTTTVGEGVSFSGNRGASIYKHPGTLSLTAWPTFGGSETEGYADIKLSSGRAVTFSGIGLGAPMQDATLRMNGSSGSETATLTFTPNTGYALIVDYNNTVITPENGAYTFTMPDADVTITATWKIQTKISLDEPPFGYKFNVFDEVGTGATLTDVVSSTAVTDENVTLTYTSSNEDVAKVVNGKIQALAVGTATITVSFAGNDKYAAAESKTITVTVVYPTMTITLPAGLSTYYGNAGVRVSDSQADGVKMYAVTAVNGDQVTLKQLPSRTVPANTPVIISNTGTEALDCQFEYALNDAGKAQFASTLAADLGVANAEAISSALAPAFVGTAEAIEAYVPANGATLYGLNGAAFVRLDAKPDIPANRCWLEIGGTTAGTRSLSIVFDDSGTTGIKAVHGDDDDSWYTIDGRKLDQAPSRKGLYIRGGRKVVRK